VRIPLKEGRTLHHDLTYRYGAGKVHLRSAPQGTGVIAGGPMRAVFEALGIQDVVSKSIGSSNPHNMVKATFYALSEIRSPRYVAAKRGKRVSDLFGRRSEAPAEGGAA
ncbi:MAG: 30S ribosomal protein S5, partial [Holosporales bacterium]